MENQTNPTNEAQVHQLIDALLAAIAAKDVDAFMSLFSPDVVTFDLWGDTFGIDVPELRNRMEMAFKAFEGPIRMELKDLKVTAGADVAFSSAIVGMHGKMGGGNDTGMAWRDSSGYKKVDGRWLVSLYHSSVPFDMTTGKAYTELKA